MTHILIADDHDIMIQGLKELLREAFPELLVGEAKNHEQIFALLNQRKWDLIMLDIMIPGSNVIETLQNIRTTDSHVPILILTAVSETEYAVRTLAAGANGYITKHSAADELVVAARKVMAGETYLSNEAATAVATGLREGPTPKLHESLSQRELEVFCLIAEGRAVMEIAYQLSVSGKTISTYVAGIKEKTGLESYVDITRYALKHQLVK